MIELHIIQPDHQIIKAQLQDGLYYAGSSSSECQLPLKFPGVSRKHLEMRVKNSVLYIKDLDSANGTLLNNYVPGGDCYEHIQNEISTSQSRT